MKRSLFPLLLSTFIMACTNNDATPDNNGQKSSVPVLPYSVVATYPHDTSSYTQGLTFWKGQFLENTGLEKKSKLAQVDLATGKSIRELPLPPQFFGEGITVLNDTLYQLTWQNHVVNVYSAKDFKKIKEFPLDIEGWGLTHDGKNLIVTNGSSNLYFYEPSTFRLLRTQGVTEDGAPAPNLNELEYVNGFVYANQYDYNYIVKIDPSSGQVVSKMDLTDLVNRAKAKNPASNVLNGIAYNPDTEKIYVTGKLWPELYEIQFNY